MNERMKILTLLQEGKITPEQADILLDALWDQPDGPKRKTESASNRAGFDFRALGAQMTATVTQTLGEVKRSLEQQFEGWPFGASISANVERQLPESIQALTIETTNGKIQAQSWNESYVRVSVRGDVKTDSLPDAKRMLDEAVQMKQTDTEIHVSVVPKSIREGVIGASIDVFLPASVRQLTLRSKNGSVQADSVHVDQLVMQTSNGGIWLYNASARDIRLTSSNGGIEVLKSVTPECKYVYATTKNGTIVVEDMAATHFVGSARTHMGHVDVKVDANTRVTFADQRRRTYATFAPIEALSAAETHIQCETNIGAIRIHAAANTTV